MIKKITLWVSNNILSSSLPSERTHKIARFIYIEKVSLIYLQFNI